MPSYIASFLVLLAFSTSMHATSVAKPPSWSPPSYPDEAGYQNRITGMVERIAAEPYLQRSMAHSICPDTGLPVFTWAVEGEEISSPYTGRRYVQGPTGYFGPKKRDSEGRINAFGGDPLKYALPPATAGLLLAIKQGEPFAAPRSANSPAGRAYAYLSIPGNMRQQYHFAATNWVRCLGLVGDKLPADWLSRFRSAIAVYEENRKPSDGIVREYQPLPRTENLVGRSEEHLGGGGTENHKTMWRTSALYYAQTFPAGSKISGFELADAEKRSTQVLVDYVKRLFTLGNGEYDSSTYYPHSFRAFVNLHDFSPKPETRAWAQAALDYYFATYGLKVFNGVQTGPQRRGWVEGDELGEMDFLLWVWAGGQPGYTTVPVDPKAISSLHQATSSYRPNRLIVDLLGKKLKLPFEARINHPDYGMAVPSQQPEYLYCSKSYAMGSVQMEAVNNSAQQTTWSLNVRGPSGSLLFGAGQPRWLQHEGHSPYDQWVQQRGSLLFMTSATASKAGEPVPQPYTLGKLEGPKSYSRQAAFSSPLSPTSVPAKGNVASLLSYFEAARTADATWLYFPREALVHTLPGRFVVETPETFVVVTPFNARGFWIDQSVLTEALPEDRKSPLAVLKRYRILSLPGPDAGFAIEAVERSQFPNLDSLKGESLRLEGLDATYHSLAGDDITLRYQPTELRPLARINGTDIDWGHWAGGLVYDSPYLKIGAGKFWLSNGQEAYEMDFTGEAPVWKSAEPVR